MFDQYAYVYVEDDPLSCQVMEMLMKTALGVERFAIFEDSTDFMARLKDLSFVPDVILLDIHLYPHDGFELLRMLHQDPAFEHSIVIALTASVMNEEVEALQASGFDGAIAKPLSVQTFPALISRILNGETIWHIA